MKRILSGKVEWVVSVFIIVALGIFLGVATVAAQETQDITPDQSFEIVTLLQGQSATVTVSQTAPFAFHTVFVTSIGNASLGATLSNITRSTSAGTSTMGWWTLMVIGARSRTFVDYSFGLVPWGGLRATVDLPSPGFGLVISSVFFTVFPENGASYSLAIGQ